MQCSGWMCAGPAVHEQRVCGESPGPAGAGGRDVQQQEEMPGPFEV